MKSKVVLFVLVPLCMNALLMLFYFSDIQFLQYLVSPKIESLHHRSWREFGLLEQLQNLFLLVILFLFCLAVYRRPDWLEKAFYLLGVLMFLFLFLEEIDYGIHYYEFYAGQGTLVDHYERNLHNREISGKSVTVYMKKLAGLVLVFWFLVFPLLTDRVNFGILNKLIPSRWFVLGFGLSMVYSGIAHYLDGLGLDIINGEKGSLTKNISEFRETNTYYLFLLYALQLLNTPSLFRRDSRDAQAGA